MLMRRNKELYLNIKLSAKICSTLWESTFNLLNFINYFSLLSGPRLWRPFTDQLSNCLTV